MTSYPSLPLERQPQPQLELPAAGGTRGLEHTSAATTGGRPAEAVFPLRSVPIPSGMIQDIEAGGAELQVEAFGQLEVPGQARVEVQPSRTIYSDAPSRRAKAVLMWSLWRTIRVETAGIETGFGHGRKRRRVVPVAIVTRPLAADFRNRANLIQAGIRDIPSRTHINVAGKNSHTINKRPYKTPPRLSTITEASVKPTAAANSLFVFAEVAFHSPARMPSALEERICDAVISANPKDVP